jgi:hypothetical protein
VKEFRDYLEAVNIKKSKLENVVEPPAYPGSHIVQDIDLRTDPNVLRKTDEKAFLRTMQDIKRADMERSKEYYKKKADKAKEIFDILLKWEKYIKTSGKMLGVFNKNGRDIKSVFEKNMTSIESKIESLSKSIIGEFKVNSIDFDITTGTKKHEVTLHLQIETNPSALGLKISKTAPKTTMEVQVYNILNNKKEAQGPFETFSKFLSDKLDIEGKMEYKNYKFQNLKITSPGSTKFNNLSFNQTRILAELQINFTLEDKKK